MNPNKPCSSLTREQILERARAASSNDPVQVVGYTDRERAVREAHRETIERLRELRALWAREAGERLAVVPPPPLPEHCGRCVCPKCIEGLRVSAEPPAPEPDGDGPPTRPSAGCGLEPPPDLHEPFPLTRVRVPGVAPRRAPPSPPGNAQRRPRAPRQRVATPPWPTRLVRLAKRLLGGKEAQQSASAFSLQPDPKLLRRARPPVRAGRATWTAQPNWRDWP